MDVIAWGWAAALSALAAWLGYRAGLRKGIAMGALLLYHCGVRGVCRIERKITFADGTTRTESGE